MLIMKFCYHGSNFRRKFQAVLEYAFRESDKNAPLPPLLSKDEALKNIGHSMSIRNLIFCVNSVTVSYLIRYDSLLQIATNVITKCNKYYYKMRQLFYYKMRQKFIRKCDSFITKCDSYCKMRRLLQIATVIAKCDVYYKLRQYNLRWLLIFFQLYSS